MKVLIVSDTHRNNENFNEALSIEKDVDMLIHCGDVEGSEYYYSEVIDGPVYMVAGNNDFFSELEMEEEFNIGNLKVFLTHGHYYRVNMGIDMLYEEAKARGADIVMFGHIHRPMIECIGGIWVINPGSISYPRQPGRDKTYIIMNIDENGEPKFELKSI